MKRIVGMPNGVDALVERDPFVAGFALRREAPSRIVSRCNRVLRERVQDVGQHQFLMLLLVIEADFDQRRDGRQRILVGLVKEFHDRRVDMAAVGGDLIGAGTGQMAALVTGVPRAGADIVGIEQEGVVGMKWLVSLAVFAQQELLEEPGGMGAVPFRRARVRHRLDQLILRGKGGGAAFGLVSDRQEGFHQILGRAAGIGK